MLGSPRARKEVPNIIACVRQRAVHEISGGRASAAGISTHCCVPRGTARRFWLAQRQVVSQINGGKHMQSIMVSRRRKHSRGCFLQPRIVCKMRWSDPPTSGRQRNGNGKSSDRRSGHISKMSTLARLFRPREWLRKEKSKKFEDTCEESEPTQSEDHNYHFKNYMCQWISKVDRGGLLKVNGSTYGFFYAMESAARLNLLPKLSKVEHARESSAVDIVRGDPAVNRYWDLIASSLTYWKVHFSLQFEASKKSVCLI